MVFVRRCYKVRGVTSSRQGRYQATISDTAANFQELQTPVLPVCSRAPKDRPRLSGDKATYMSGVPVSDGICSCPSSIRPCSSPVHPSICFLPCSLPDTNQSPVLAASGGQSARAPGEGRKRGHSLRLERARWQAPRPGPFGDGHLTP